MAELAVLAMGPDRPGIVAAVADVLREHGGNVEDSAMTILGGRFTLALLVSTATSPADLQAALTTATVHLGLHVSVEPAGDTSDHVAPTHLLSVYGEDQPGILSAVSTALAEAGANVTDLATRLLGESTTPVWSMVVEFSTDDEAAVRAGIADVAERLGVDHTLRQLDQPTY